MSSSSNGSSPVTIAYNRIPALQMSAALVYLCPRIISGGAYAGEPQAVFSSGESIEKESDMLRRNMIVFKKRLKDALSTQVELIEDIEILVKYEGYIKKQKKDAEKLKKLDSFILPKNIDYLNMDGLALEARQKLDLIRPQSIGQASRISGINPSDITILNLYLNKHKK